MLIGTPDEGLRRLLSASLPRRRLSRSAGIPRPLSSPSMIFSAFVSVLAGVKVGEPLATTAAWRAANRLARNRTEMSLGPGRSARKGRVVNQRRHDGRSRPGGPVGLRTSMEGAARCFPLPFLVRSLDLCCWKADITKQSELELVSCLILHAGCAGSRLLGDGGSPMLEVAR